MAKIWAMPGNAERIVREAVEMSAPYRSAQQGPGHVLTLPHLMSDRLLDWGVFDGLARRGQTPNEPHVVAIDEPALREFAAKVLAEFAVRFQNSPGQYEEYFYGEVILLRDRARRLGGDRNAIKPFSRQGGLANFG